MRGRGTNAVLAIAGLLGLLLIVYVFAGADAQGPDRAPHCPSQNALAQIKGELFRRAGELRGSTDAAFSHVQNYSIVRAQSRMLRRHRGRSGSVSCSGTIALDLPPGAVAAGGRSSLVGPVTYDLQPHTRGAARLLNPSKADAIIAPLATVSLSSDQPGTAQPAVQAVQRRTPQTETGTAAPQPAQRRPQRPPPESLPPPRATALQRPARRPIPPPAAAKPRHASSPHAAAPTGSPAPAPVASAARPAPVPAATPKPSFNCRYARTRGEIAVCRDGGLASLDRQMSAQFGKAMAAGRPGQRAMLRNTRTRFLHYRDSCASHACIEDAYRGRIREINDIMTGGW